MGSSVAEFDRIRHELQSAEPATRGRAMQALLLLVKKDRSIDLFALPIFWSAIETETYAWTAVSAVRGIEYLLGPDVARPAWRKLMLRDDPQFVGSVVLAADHPSHVPLLLEVLSRATDLRVRTCAVRVLGRSKDPTVYSALIGQLADPAMRVDAVQALEDFGDPRAIPAIRPFLDDKTEVGREDDRGAMLYLADLAGYAVRRLEFIQGTPENRTAPPLAGHVDPPARRRGGIPWPTVLAFVPLTATIGEVPWILVGLVVYLFLGGTTHPSDDVNRLLDLIGMLPCLFGMMIGLFRLRHIRGRPAWEAAVLGVGLLGCGFVIFCFGHELLFG